MTKVEKVAKKVHRKYFEKHQKNPKVVRKIDKLMMTVGFIGPAATFFQFIHVILVRDTGGLSIYSWLAYVFVNLCWFLYGFLHKSKPLIIVNTLGFLASLGIVIEFIILK